jgi:copper transport protein
VVVIAILGIVALWRFAPPPRALVVAAKTPFFTHIHTTKAMADVTINPGNVGTVHATIVLRRPEDEAPLEAKEVTLILSKPGSQIPPLTRHASRAHDGSWRVDDLTIASPGRWQVEVDARTSDVDLAVLSASIEIKP